MFFIRSVTVNGVPLLKCFPATPSSVRFIVNAVNDNCFSRRFFRTREKRPEHYRRSACREGFYDISRIANSSIGDDRNTAFLGDRNHIEHGRELRNANAAYNASCANGTGADADLQRVRDTGKIARGFLRYDIADNELRSHLAFHFARGGNDSRRVSMRAIYKND